MWMVGAAVALQCLMPGVALAQGDPDMDKGMGSFYLEKWDEAIPAFDSALKHEPQNTLAMAYLLHCYFKKKDFTTIVNKMEQAAVNNGSDAIAQAHLGMAYFLKGLVMPNALDEALTEFKNSVKEDPRCSMAYAGTGMVYFQKRMMPRSKGYFVRALRINPHDVMALDRLGNILLVDEKKPDEALQLYQRIVEELPAYPDGHYFVGSALYDLKRYDEAIPHLARCLELDPKGITQGYDAGRLLGDTYMRLNRMADAEKVFQDLLKRSPEDKYVQIKLEKIKAPVKDVPKDTSSTTNTTN